MVTGEGTSFLCVISPGFTSRDSRNGVLNKLKYDAVTNYIGNLCTPLTYHIKAPINITMKSMAN